MREILFKAKRIDNGEWAEGSYAYAFNEDENCHVVGIMKECHYIVEKVGNLLLIDKDTICQYTGLTDKNGNKIWENDVVIGREGYCGNPKLPTREIKFKVEYSRGHYRWLDSADMYEYEVIGNIFDNPELLKGE